MSSSPAPEREPDSRACSGLARCARLAGVFLLLAAAGAPLAGQGPKVFAPLGRQRPPGTGAEAPGAGLAECPSIDLPCPGARTGELDTSDCRRINGALLDVYSVTLDGPGRLAASLGSSRFDTFLELYDGDFVRIAFDDDSGPGRDSFLVAEIEEAGIYHLGATSFTSASRGAYDLEVECLPPLSPCDDCLRDGIACEETVAGRLEGGACTTGDGRSLALHPFEVAIRARVLLRAVSGSFEPALRLLGPDCQSLDSAPAAGREGSVLVVDLDPGAYVVEVRGSAIEPPGSYTLERRCLEASDPCTDCEPLDPPCGGTAAGELSDGECPTSAGGWGDVYPVETGPGGRYEFTVTSTDFTPTLRLLDGECGEVEAETVREPGSFRLSAQLPGGSFRLIVSSQEAVATGAYELSAECGEGFERCEDCLVDTLFCGETGTGILPTTPCRTLDGRSVDVHRLELEEDGRYAVRMRSPTFRAQVALHDATCEELSSDRAFFADQEALIAVDLPAGTYFVAASGAGEDDEGVYEISVECAPGFDLCSTCDLQPLGCGDEILGGFPTTGCRLDSGERVDMYPLSVDTSSRVAILAASSDFDVDVELYDAACERIAGDEDGGPGTDALLAVDLPAGEYRVGVTSGRADGSGTFRLEVRCVEGFSLCDDCRVGSVECGGSYDGLFPTGFCVSEEGDLTDLVSLDVAVGGPVVIDLRSEDFDVRLSLLDAGCAEVAADSDGGEGQDARIVASLDPGSYLVGVRSERERQTGAYSLTVSCPDPRPCEDCVVDELRPGESASGALAEGDCVLADSSLVDVYELRVDRPAWIEVELMASELAAHILLLDDLCREMDRAAPGAAGPGMTARLEATLKEGTHYIAIAGASAEDGGEYTLRADGRPIDPCLDCEGEPIACGRLVTGRLDAASCRDDDGRHVVAHELVLDEDATVDIILSSTTFDPVLRVVDGRCLRLASNDDCRGRGPESCLSVPLEAGRYSLLCTSVEPDALGPYDLVVTSCVPDAACDPCEPDPLSCAASRTGTLEGSDCRTPSGAPQDLFRLELSEAREVELTLRSVDFDPFLELRSEGCLLVAGNDDGGPGLDSRILAEVGRGVYLIATRSLSTTSRGDYSLEVACRPIERCVACRIDDLVAGEPRHGDLGASGCARVTGQYLDLWAFDVPDERWIRIAVASEAFDPELLLYDEECLEIARERGGGSDPSNAEIRARLAPGRYHVGVSSLLLRRSGAYRIALSAGLDSGGSQLPGDCNQDSSVNVADAVCLLGHLFRGSPASLPCGDGTIEDAANLAVLDVNGDRAINLSDPVAILLWLFRGGEPPVLGTGCVRVAGCPEACAP